MTSVNAGKNMYYWVRNPTTPHKLIRVHYDDLEPGDFCEPVEEPTEEEETEKE